MEQNNLNLMIKYGELVLKKGNRSTFLFTLISNIKKALQNFQLTYEVKYDYLLIKDVNQDHFYEIISILKQIPGITKIYLAKLYPRTFNLDQLSTEIINEIKYKAKKKFRVSIKRKDKSFPMTSMEFANKLAGKILRQFHDLIVDLVDFDLEIYVEIHKNYFFVLSEEINGFGGLPVMKSNRTLVLLSGGIDSPVASKLMLKKGFNLDFVTFISPPFTSIEAKNKTIELAKQITLNNKLCNSRLFIIHYTNLQNEISHISDPSYKINLMRRSFFRIAGKLCNYLKIPSITTGESLGQVASQTIESMKTISVALNQNILLFRPLLCFDKEEIISLAKKYGTYEISIKPYPDSCAVFAPENPITHPFLDKAIALESELSLLKDLEEVACLKENMEIIKLW